MTQSTVEQVNILNYRLQTTEVLLVLFNRPIYISDVLCL